MMHKQNPFSQNVEQLRVPPHSLQAEQAVIAAVLADNQRLDLVAPIITADDFYTATNRIIFAGILEMAGMAMVADMTTLPDHLRTKGQLDEIGGESTVYQLAMASGSQAGLQTYANVVRNRSMLRQAIGAASDVTEQCYHSDGSDAIEILGNAEKLIGEVSERLLTKEQDYSIHEAMAATIAQIEKRVESEREIAGLSTGIPDLDKMINGLEDADMVVVAARPSMGKTTFAMNMVTKETIREGGRPVVFSLEMPREQLMYKMMSSLGQIPISSLQRPNGKEGMTDHYWSKTSQVMAQLKQTKLEIIDDAYMTIPRMRLEIRRYQKKHGKPTLIMVDYLQLIRGTTKTDNRTNEISEISRGIKALAKEFNCPVVVLSQLSRSLETRNNKRPRNSDLRESGQIEQDADKILFIYRDEVYNENSADKGKAELIVGKARMGEIGMAGSKFRGLFSEFTPLGENDN